MKKNNSYLADDEIDLGDIIKSLWREKILILSISIICGLAFYLYVFFQPQQLKREIILKDPPPQLFESYNDVFDKNNNKTNIVEQFTTDFKLNLLSSDNLQSYIEQSSEFDVFNRYLKSRNISVKKFFENKLTEVTEKNSIISNKYFLIFPKGLKSDTLKELDRDIFLGNYVKFVKKKTIVSLKKNLKLSIENRIVLHEASLQKAKIINLENPILRSINQATLIINEPNELFYKGSKILLQEIDSLKKLLIKLENDQFDFEIISDQPLNFQVKLISDLVYFVIGIMLGLFLSFGIIFLKGTRSN
jgi:LPS O-antigen subunit length determinant protein (WzzB/FepE family)